MRHSTLYTLVFALIICVVCGILVSTAAVSLKELQVANSTLDRQKKVLEAAGLIESNQVITADEVAQHFGRIESKIVDLRTGELTEEVEPETYNQRKAQLDPALSHPAPSNNAGIKRLPNHAQLFFVNDEQGNVEMLVLPIEGLGLWGTLYGYLALDADGETVRGITYYEHKETPGLGGEVDNPVWKALWPGRKVYRNGDVALGVIKGPADSVEEDPHHVDGLSGATITSRGVTNMLHFWFGEHGFGPFLERFRAQQET